MIKKLSNLESTDYRLWYNRWIEENTVGNLNVLDVGKSKYWDYGFPTIDINSRLKPTFIGNIEKTNFNDETFDIVLCNGMYEVVDNPQKMIDEVVRITKIGGLDIFGFVGKEYKPYRKNWKYFDNKESFGNNLFNKIHFGNDYHFIICRKK